MPKPLTISTRTVAEHTTAGGAHLVVTATTTDAANPITDYGWRCYGCGHGSDNPATASGIESSHRVIAEQADAHATTCQARPGNAAR